MSKSQAALRTELEVMGIKTNKEVFYNLPPAELVERALAAGEGILSDTGALAYDTGKFTGRAPKDRYVVKDANTADTVWWGPVNFEFDPQKFDVLFDKLCAYLSDKDLYVRDAYAGADPTYRLNVRVVGVKAAHNLFCYNMFIRPKEEELSDFTPGFTVVSCADFEADPAVDGTKNKNFAIINFTRRMIIIGGTAYTGETKKGIFSVLNYLLPHERGVLSMHCSANIGQNGDTAIFFGLSGTGKTTLSADPDRGLIGDDEHGWSENGIFNFEGGCYAKAIDLSREKEPEIFDAIKFGALLENTRFFPGTRGVDYANKSVTENTRVSYPIYYISNAVEPSVGGIPQNIFFLTADAYGVLPPISLLTPGQAMYHFISGYTAKVAGTEVGVVEPQATFSACFGQAFLPLHPTKYAEMLGKKMKEHQVKVWLINTGWTGGPYGVGSRMKLKFTRAMITAALNGQLDEVAYVNHSVFGVAVPQSCPQVPSDILNPRETWADKAAYDEKALHLAQLFVNNFKTFQDFANQEIISGAPKA